MDKTSMNSIYGNYISYDFVDKLHEIAIDAKKRATLNRNDQAFKNIHSMSTRHSVEAVYFWDKVIKQCREYKTEKQKEEKFKQGTLF